MKPAGHPLVIYHEFGPDAVDVEVCVPVARPSSVGGPVASTLHVGPYEDLGAAYAALTE